MSWARLARFRGRPRQVVVQLTDRCNARCPQCGMNVTRGGVRGDLDEAAARRIVDHCARLGVSALSFTGGEPLLAGDRLFDVLAYADRRGIAYLRTGTNGWTFARPEAADFEVRVERLAANLVRSRVRNFWISLDSADPATHEAGRGLPGVVEGIKRALPLLAAHGIYPTANLALNRFMGGPVPLGGDPDALYAAARDGLGRFFDQALALGFTMANCCYPMSDADADKGTRAVYAATADDARVTFADAEKCALFRAVLDVVPRYRGRLRIFTPLCAVYALWRQYSVPAFRPRPCLGGVSFLFVDRQGDAFPCGYRGGENLGPFGELDPSVLDKEPHCLACDWECFRDPSELFGPVGELLAGPLGWGRLWRADRRQLGLWLADLRYAAACGWFDGRRPPRPERLARFATG